jgi:predicted nuclease of restriction endonuclease-like RecB superfamily
MILTELNTLKPENDTLEQGLILILKLSYNISEADADRVHQLSMNMFQHGCVVGAETVVEALQTEAKLHQAASALSSSLSN